MIHGAEESLLKARGWVTEYMGGKEKVGHEFGGGCDWEHAEIHTPILAIFTNEIDKVCEVRIGNGVDRDSQ